MQNVANLRVQIAPVGFEVDRIVIPVKQTRADKVWLLVHDNPSADKSLPYQRKLEKEFKKEKIQVEIARVDRLNLFATIKTVREIIEKEKENAIYVNVASGSKIQAIACMMACMIFKGKNNIRPFYAEAERYAAFEGKQQSFGVKRTIALPTYEIQTPKTELQDPFHHSKFQQIWLHKRDNESMEALFRFVVCYKRDSQATLPYDCVF